MLAGFYSMSLSAIITFNVTKLKLDDMLLFF